MAQLRIATAAAVLAVGLGWARADAEAPATQPAKPAAVSEEQARQDRIWARNWPIYAKRFFLVDGDFIINKYDPKYANSRGLTLERANDKLARRTEVRVAMNSSRTVTTYAPRAEVEVIAMVLPELQIGEYGYVHSFVVEEVLGPNEMLVSQLWLIDREQLQKDRNRAWNDIPWSRDRDERIEFMFKERQAAASRQDNDNYFRRMKVEGVSTKTMVPGQRYKGPGGRGIQLVVAGRAQHQRGYYYSGSSQMPVLLATDALKTGLTEDQFEGLLAKKNFTREQFLALVADERRKGASGAEDRVVEAIDAAGNVPEEQASSDK